MKFYKACALLAISTAGFVSAQTQVDYPTQVKNGPMFSDAVPVANTLQQFCTTVGTGTLAVTRKWLALTTQTIPCNLIFTGGSLQPAAGQVVTLAKFPTCPPNQQCFDTSLGGTRSIKFTGPIYSPVYAAWFGAVCNGITDPANGAFHDDYPALMSAHSSLPLSGFNGGFTPSGIPLPMGTVILPGAVLQTPQAYLGTCMLGPSEPGLLWSPYVRLDAGTTAISAGIQAAQGWAPQVGGNYTITGINTCGGGVTCTVQIAGGTSGLANGDTVEIHGIAGFQQTGPYILNSWANNNQQTLTNAFAPVSGMWTLANATPTSVDLVNSGNPGYLQTMQPWVSGGVMVKGTEKFLLTIINVNEGANPYPNDNFTVDISHVLLVAAAAGNEFASGFYCNCSDSTYLRQLYITVPYRSIVGAIGVDNVTMDALTLSSTGTKGRGPDGIALELLTNDPLETFAVAIRNLKVNGGSYMDWTPAVVIAGAPTTIHIDVADFEGVAWPIAIALGNQPSEDISIEHITAHDDTFPPGPCGGKWTYPPNSLLNTVVAILGQPATNPGNVSGFGIKTSGTFQCYGNSVTIGADPSTLNQVPGMPLPFGFTDFKFYSLAYDDGNFVTHSFLPSPWSSTTTYFNPMMVTCDLSVCTTQGQQTVQYLALNSPYLPGVSGQRPDTSPAYWTRTGTTPSGALYSTNAVPFTGFRQVAYFGTDYTPWFGGSSINWQTLYNSPALSAPGYRCFSIVGGLGVTGANNRELGILSFDDCNATFGANPHFFIEFRPPNAPCPSSSMSFGHAICIDSQGTEGTTIGGDLLVGGVSRQEGVNFANLPARTPGTNGYMVWVNDAVYGSEPCTGGPGIGNGAWAKSYGTGPGTFALTCK